MRKIDPEKLVPMDHYAASAPFRIELAYAGENNLLFGEPIYRPDARLWLHEDLAKIVVLAAQDCYNLHGFRYVLYDGLRTVDAQEAMLRTQRVKDNPHWLQEPRLLSPPGMGGHPRGMAIDIGLETKEGLLVDMGTAFDFLAAESSPEKNPAHRDYKNLEPAIKRNRACLTDTMLNAARSLNTPLVPLPQEWWDFRLPSEIYTLYAPLADSDLPPEMRMMSPAPT